MHKCAQTDRQAVLLFCLTVDVTPGINKAQHFLQMVLFTDGSLRRESHTIMKLHHKCVCLFQINITPNGNVTGISTVTHCLSTSRLEMVFWVKQ